MQTLVNGVLRLLVFAAILVVAACGAGTKQLTDPLIGSWHHPCADTSIEGRGLFAPDPICPSYPIGNVDGKPTLVTASEADRSTNPPLSNDWIEAAMRDSENKCERYLGSFTGQQAGENTAFDVTALVLTGLASVFTPANTVRALAAASTGVQGTKAAINTDLYQQATILLFMQQIDATYYKALQSFADKPPQKATDAYLQIQLIHSQCSFQRALVGIGAKTATAAAAPAKVDLTAFTAGSTEKCTSKDGSTIYAVTVSSGTPQTYSIQVTSNGVRRPAISYGTDHVTAEDVLNSAGVTCAKSG